MKENQQMNSIGWTEAIREYAQRIDHGRDGDNEQARNEAIESVLEFKMRSGWADYASKFEPAEFFILLSTGGPALRVIGDLDADGSPDTAKLQWQSWGTPWTDVEMSAETAEAVATFASCFYFGK